MSTSMPMTGEPATEAPGWCALSVVPDGPEPFPEVTGDVLAILVRAAIGAHPHDVVAGERFVRIRIGPPHAGRLAARVAAVLSSLRAISEATPTPDGRGCSQ